MKTLITHINPHLDDIVAIWLIKKFFPEFKDARINFISAEAGKQGFKEDNNTLYIGVGMGKYDEHKGDLDDSAGSLVWKDIKSKNLAPNDLETNALEELVKWNTDIDLGKAPLSQFSEFSIQSFIRPEKTSDESSKKAVQLGEEILNRVFEVLKKKEQSLKDWQKRIEFESKFGKSSAVISETIDRPFCKKQGGDLFLMYHPKYQSVQFFTPSMNIDLEPIYQKVRSLDNEADWFLHQSHHMVICGSGSAPNSKKTKLTFEQLIEIAKSVGR